MEIALTQGKKALVDPEDFAELSQHRWYAYKAGRTYYAARMQRLSCGAKTRITMHAQILRPSEGLSPDHINQEGLDNRRSNLRLATSQENAQNRRSQLNSSSKYLGVSWDKNKKLWQVTIRVEGRKKFLGRYLSEEFAASIYDKAAQEAFGEFANLNFKS